MREYSLALYLMTMFGEGYKVCQGVGATDPEHLGILYEMLFRGIQFETLRLHRCFSLFLANLTQSKCLFKYQEHERIKLNSNIVLSAIHSCYCSNNNVVTVKIAAIAIQGYTHITLLGTACLYPNSTMRYPPPHKKFPGCNILVKCNYVLRIVYCLMPLDTLFF